jgi:hypothetical protein
MEKAVKGSGSLGRKGLLVVVVLTCSETKLTVRGCARG